MARFFVLWNTKPTDETVTRQDNVSKFLYETNETFKAFLTSCSWLVYLMAAALIACCTYYYYYDCKRRLDLRRRRQEVQRANERSVMPQRRRPGAAYRDHEIFRNVMKTVRQYIGPNEGKQPNTKPYVLRRTRSGAIYGRFADRDNING